MITIRRLGAGSPTLHPVDQGKVNLFGEIEREPISGFCAHARLQSRRGRIEFGSLLGMISHIRANVWAGITLLVLLFAQGLKSAEVCEIQVIDADRGWPVPLVELRTTNHVRFFSDNRGVIAFDLPELMGREVWFYVEGHGYGVKPDGFGYRGVRLTPRAGKKLTVKVNRELPARRLGRITGSGLFEESRKLGWKGGAPESGVLGCDSVQIASHKGKLFWAWGDTKVSKYPLGLFHASSATTGLRPLQNYEPPLQISLEYFRSETGEVRNVARMPGEGPTWLSGYVSLPDQKGHSRLVSTYVKVKGILDIYEKGLCVWNDETENFEQESVLWREDEGEEGETLFPDGHPVFYTDGSGEEWLLFGDPFPRLRMKPTFEAWKNPDEWEKIEPQESVIVRESGEGIFPHRGSIAWSGYRKKWVSVFTQREGLSSKLGEIWYAEANSPMGPWEDAMQVVTHHNYTFYNPRLHPDLTDADSPILLFEGTFTHTFADHAIPVPQHDYNQVMYRLDLDDAAFE